MMLDHPAIMGLLGDARPAFERMGVAEEEIAQAGAQHHQGIFRACRPSEAIRGARPEVYRAHVRELCHRAAQDLPLAPGTAAEVASVVHTVSLKAPLNFEGSLLYWEAIRRMGLMVEGADNQGPDVAPREQWEGQADELMAEAAEKTAFPWRDD